ncbi:MAG: indole-3-glycerol-phosphate synthase [Syntrophomonadaceae bacterium]|nr:indole-3-glycerol-phosphate synthase [Syntrophomonadaceae bacterium]
MSISGPKYSAVLWNEYHSGKIPVIPDIKLRSPQAGNLIQGRNPGELAEALVAAGAPVLSVVTEPVYFGGSTDLLRLIVQAVSVPVLRKDFIKESEQVKESADLGARAVLLIAAMLERPQLFKLVEESLMLGLEPLVEAHNEAEIMSVKELELNMIGINNRSIVELEMDDGSVNTTEKLAGLIHPGSLIISESSISSSPDVQRAMAAGAHAVLVGTAILQAPDPAKMYRRLSETRW